jgi:hypothetical protein
VVVDEGDYGHALPQQPDRLRVRRHLAAAVARANPRSVPVFTETYCTQQRIVGLSYQGLWSLLDPDFPDGSVVSARRLRHFPGKPSVSDLVLPK